MKTGIELFSLNDENILSQTKKFETEFEYEIPPLHKAFISLFKGDKRILFICNDIFEFLRNLILKDEDSPGYGVKSYKQLYKNWGEDFWRVREDTNL